MYGGWGGYVAGCRGMTKRSRNREEEEGRHNARMGGGTCMLPCHGTGLVARLPEVIYGLCSVMNRVNL